MKIIPEPCSVSKAEVSWLVRALARDCSPSILTYGAFIHFDGAANLVTSDTHRLHVLRLGPSKPFETKLVDLRRLVFEMSYAKATTAWVDVLLSTFEIETFVKNVVELGSVYANLFPTRLGTYPDVERVIPKTTRQASDVFAVNSRYFVDATVLSAVNAFRTLILAEGPNKPIMFRPNAEPTRWFAVVMPMSLEGDWSNKEKSK